MIPAWQWFPYAVSALELCAAGVYCYYHNWRFAIVWAGVGIANAAFAGTKP